MSILLSAYFPEGIVFAADKNITQLYEGPDRTPIEEIEAGAATKVIPWAQRKAVVGFCGLGQLAGIPIWEWMRQFAAHERDFDDLQSLAAKLRDAIQHDFDNEFPEGTDISESGLIVHLGGFRYQDGIAVPAMYLITNVPGYDQCGRYSDAIRSFGEPSDQFLKTFEDTSPAEIRQQLAAFYKAKHLIWFNNGLYFPAFNVFKDALWQAVTVVRSMPCDFLTDTLTLDDHVAYCKMTVELFGSFFKHNLRPNSRKIGGGVDAEWVPWPEKR